MSNLRRILPLLLCLSLLCACVQMPNAPQDETPLQSPLPTATSESSAAPPRPPRRSRPWCPPWRLPMTTRPAPHR